MARKRMFSILIVDSDAFLDMPLSAQALYFHLNMRADDDGFIGNAKRIQRMIGSNDDDLKLLIGKRFLIPFEEGVLVIKHWRIHNTIQSDRYTPTVYVEEKAMICEKDNKAYTLSPVNSLETKWKQNDNTDKGLDIDLDTGKDIDKKKRENINYQQIADMYNNTCVSFPRLISMSDSRKKAIRARLRTYTIADFDRLFVKAEESSFLKGKSNSDWSATFDWLIKDKNMEKVLEGNYDNKEQPPHGPPNNPADKQQQSRDMMLGWVQSKEGQDGN